MIRYDSNHCKLSNYVPIFKEYYNLVCLNNFLDSTYFHINEAIIQ